MKNTIIYLILISSSIVSLFGQGMPGGGGGGAEHNDENFSFMPIPYISYNRSLGLMGGAVPMCMYNLSKKDTISPSSISGVFGMYSTNDTWFGMAFSKFYLKEDKWRLTTAGGVGSVNFQFFFDNPISPQYIDYITGMAFA